MHFYSSFMCVAISLLRAKAPASRALIKINFTCLDESALCILNMFPFDNIITTDDGINIDFIYIDKKEHLGLKTQIEKLQDLLQISDK